MRETEIFAFENLMPGVFRISCVQFTLPRQSLFECNANFTMVEKILDNLYFFVIGSIMPDKLSSQSKGRTIGFSMVILKYLSV